MTLETAVPLRVVALVTESVSGSGVTSNKTVEVFSCSLIT